MDGSLKKSRLPNGSPNDTQTGTTQQAPTFDPQTGDSPQPPLMCGFADLGWQERSLPDSTRYFSHTERQIVTDIDLGNADSLQSITTFLDSGYTEIRPPPDWELWLRESSELTAVFAPRKSWIHHGARKLSHDCPSSKPKEAINKPDDGTFVRFHLTRFSR
jgi:hypothetical protein